MPHTSHTVGIYISTSPQVINPFIQHPQMKITILGAGESGVGAAVLAADRGHQVFVSDFGTISQKYLDVLTAEGIPYEQGGHTMNRVLDADLVIKSPGIARSTPVMQAIAGKGIPVVSEIEFAGRYTDAFMICITGSNGKTTTTMLTHHILRDAGIDASLAGNIGMSLAWQVARSPHKVYVIELSSFQLDDMHRFRADIAVMLNITPDHLDRYDHKMANYVAAKFRILQNMTADQAFVYWAADPVMADFMKNIDIKPRRYPFAQTFRPGMSAWSDDDNVMHVGTFSPQFSMNRHNMALKGIHNLYNSLAAASVAGLMDVPADKVAQAMASFSPVEHRMEFVADIDGVRYINDSKATNVNSTFYALGAMTAPTVLILGGKDKGNDYSEIDTLVDTHVHTIVAMGKDNTKIINHFGRRLPVIDTHSLADALGACRRAARKGDTVLLSPCCASFDLFSSYEDRGRQFKAAVRALSPGEGNGK